jgi:hypothetical protein
MIEYKNLNREELKSFINSNEFEKLKVLPISRHRAISHIYNPTAEKNDILLLLACKDKEIIGYLGILPDKVIVKNDKSLKCGWLSCFWVDSSMRGKGIGLELMLKSLEIWNNNLLGVDYVPFTKIIYNKTGAFTNPISKAGVKLYLRFDLHTLLPPKNKIFNKAQLLFKVSDYIFNLFSDLRFLFPRSNIGNMNFEYVDNVDAETGQFISKFQGTELFRRGMNELNWILKYPWVLSAKEKDELNKKYYFSSVDKSFNFYCIKMNNDKGNLNAFLIFAKRNKTLKLPYCYFEKNALPEVISLIERHLLKWRINTFVSFHPDIMSYFMSHRTFSLFKKKIKRNFLLSEVLEDAIKNIPFDIQDGAGDSVFT